MNNPELKILIVDDTPKNIQVVAGFLQNEGYILSFARSGREAIETLLKEKHDLVLLDVVMPEMDGFETCKEIKKHDELADLPIIFLTVKNDTESIVKGFEIGGDDYITKPFNPYELLARVKTRLQLKHHMELNRRNDQMLLQRSRSAMLSELISNIAHQWRQPLTVLSINIGEIGEVINQGIDNKEYLDALVKKSNDTIQKLSRTITDFSRYFSPDEERGVFLIKSVLDEVMEMGQSFIVGAISFRLEMTDDGLKVDGFSREFFQVMLILVNNAIDALSQLEEEGERQILIKAERIGSMVRVSVCDNGPGIDDVIADKLFDPYTTTKHMAMDTGMGLYMAKIIIENHMNGKVEGENSSFTLDGEACTGACFSVTLPAV